MCMFQTLCIKQGYAGVVGGATPGKKIMHLKVISFEDIRETGNRNIAVTGARDPGFFKWVSSYIFITILHCFFSSPEHIVLRVSYCDRPLSVFRRRPPTFLLKHLLL